MRDFYPVQHGRPHGYHFTSEADLMAEAETRYWYDPVFSARVKTARGALDRLSHGRSDTQALALALLMADVNPTTFRYDRERSQPEPYDEPIRWVGHGRDKPWE